MSVRGAEEKEGYLPVILNRVVPQEAHLPLMAWRPFLKVTVFGEVISLDFFSFTQKARVTGGTPSGPDIRRGAAAGGQSR